MTVYDKMPYEHDLLQIKSHQNKNKIGKPQKSLCLQRKSIEENR